MEFLFAWFDSRGKVAGKDEVLMHREIAGLLKEKKGVRDAPHVDHEQQQNNNLRLPTVRCCLRFR
jgi:hypothetical protein